MRKSKGLLAAAGARANDGGNLVTDGLLLYYDAGITESYPGTGTTWTDLVSNTPATLERGAAYSSNNGGEIVFQKALQSYAAVAPDTRFNLSGGTFIVWLRLSSLPEPGDQWGFFFGRLPYPETPVGINLYVGTRNVGYHWKEDPNTYGLNSGLTIPVQEMCMAAVSVQTDFADLYLCQSSGTTSVRNTNNHGPLVVSNIDIGRDNKRSGRRMDGSIAIAQLYDRALSSTEIEQNFNAFKGRFGL